MRPVSTLTGALVRFAAVYALMLVAWPVVGGAYGAAFRGAATALFGSLHRDGEIRYERAGGGKDYADTTVVIVNRRTNMQASRPLSTRYRGYFPAAALLALVIASPVPRPRRAWALLWGMIALHAVLGLRELIILLEALSAPGPVAILDLGRWPRAVLRSLARPLSHSVIGPYVLALLVWIPVTFRSSDWVRLVPAVSRRGTKRT